MGFLEGKTAIITGGGRAVLKDGSCGSIGYGIATAYAKEGANLVITGRNVQKLEDAKEELERLYGASITPSVRKLGEIQAVGFEAEFADDGAVGEEIFPRLAADVADLLLHPNTRGGLLRPDIVGSEREKLLERIRAGMNNKRAYAIERLYAHMCCCEDYAVPRLGEEAVALHHLRHRPLEGPGRLLGVGDYGDQQWGMPL